MPIFVKGEPLQRSLAPSPTGGDGDETGFDEYLDSSETALMQTALPSRDDDEEFGNRVINIDTMDALDMIQCRISNAQQKGPLADDLSSVESMSPWTPARTLRTAVSVVKPVAEYDASLDVVPQLVQPARGGLSIDTTTTTTAMGGGWHQHSNTSADFSDITTSPYELNAAPSWEKYRRQTAHYRTRPQLSVVTDVDDETREDQNDVRHGGSPARNSGYERDSAKTLPEGEATGHGEDEPSKTLEEMVGLLEKGYRVKLHTFKGRERAFIFLRDDEKTLCIRKDTKQKKDKDDEGNLFLDTSIDNIESLEFGRRTDSGFLLSPLTSFSLGIIDQGAESDMRFYDLDAASPVQREVLVSTLMILMDAYGGKGEVVPSNPEISDGVEDRYDDQLGEVPDESNGTFDQPILCSPSLEAIPCSPSLEIEANQLGSRSEEETDTGNDKDVIQLDDADRPADYQKRRRAFFGSSGKRENVFIDTRALEEEKEVEHVSSGEMTDQASNVTGSITSGMPVVTMADDLVIEAHLSDQAFSGEENGDSAEAETDQPGIESPPETRIRAEEPLSAVDAQETGTIMPRSSEIGAYHLPDETDNESEAPKEENYVFKEDGSIITGTGSATMPIVIDDDIDPITALRSKPHALSFSFSDVSFDYECNESVQGIMNSVRSRRLTRRLSGNPSYPSRIPEVTELHDMSFNEPKPPRPLRASTTGPYSYENYGDLRIQDSKSTSLAKGADDENDANCDPTDTSVVETSTLAEMKSGLEVPTPHNLQIGGSSSHLTGGWCSDDVCTGTLNDMAKTCTGIFATQGAKHIVSQAGCIDTGFTAEQSIMVEEYIASALGAPTAVYSYFADGEQQQALEGSPSSLSPPVSTKGRQTPSAATEEESGGQKFRNRAFRSNNAQADRIRDLKNEMTFAHALQQSKERSFIRTTQSFDDAKFLPKLADNAAQKLHSSPLLDSLVTNMISHWANDANNGPIQEVTQEEESVYYDSDPEDSRPRTMQHDPRKIQAVVRKKDAKQDEESRPKVLDGPGIDHLNAKLSKRADEDTVKEIVQTMMNERLLVMWHPTQSSDDPNRAPVLARLWIESGVYLIDGSFLLPKLSWVKAFRQPRQGSIGITEEPNKVDLLDICRIRTCDQVDRSLHPFANSRLSWFVETQQDVFLFESETAEERNRIVYGLKLVVARLASLLMLRDIRAADEFFGAVSNGVPGEAPVWKAESSRDQDGEEEEASAAAAPRPDRPRPRKKR